MSIWRIDYDTRLPKSASMPELKYLGEGLMCIGAIILFAIMLCITIIARLIVFAISQKKQGKKAIIPLIIAFLLILMLLFILQ